MTDLSEAIIVHLKHFPRGNEAEFRATVTTEAGRDAVLVILDETRAIKIDWQHKSLGEIGDEVRDVMRARHPELSDAALRKLANYFTYLVK